MHKVQDDYPGDQLVAFFRGQDAIVSTIPGSKRKAQFQIIDAAVTAGVKRFVPSEFGGDTLHPSRYDFLTMFKSNVEIPEYLRTQESKNFSWSALATGPFFDWYSSFVHPIGCGRALTSSNHRAMKRALFGYDLKARKALIYDSGDSRFATTTMATIGAAIAGILRHPEETANQFIFVASFTTSQNEILGALERVSGKKWDVQRTTTVEAARVGMEKFGKGNGGVLDLLLATVYTERTGSNFEENHELANVLLDLPKENLDAVVTRLLEL